jgi:hypothetical protein
MNPFRPQFTDKERFKFVNKAFCELLVPRNGTLRKIWGLKFGQKDFGRNLLAKTNLSL